MTDAQKAWRQSLRDIPTTYTTEADYDALLAVDEDKNLTHAIWSKTLMASILKVDKLDPQSGTALEIGTSGDTVTVPTGAGLTVTDEVKTNKVSPATGTAFALGDSGDTFTVPSGATIVNSGTATGFGISSSNFLPTAAPLIINGNMAMAQRGTSFAAVGDGVYTLDRFETNKVMDAVATITQETLTSGNAYADGFKNAFKVDVTTADASLTGAQRLLIQQGIEAQDLQVLKFGTANAEKLTLSFWIKATKTGLNVVRMYAPDDNRSCSQSYTVDSTDTWEKKVLNFPVDTTGVIDNDTGPGIQVAWCIGAGPDFQSGTLATTWGTQVSANDFVGQVNNLDSTSNNFHITGVQLEVGEYTSSDIPPFRHETYGDNLLRCQRYYETQTGFYWFGFQSGTNVTHNSMASCKVEKRATPSGTYSGSVVNYYPNTGGGNDETNNITAITVGDKNGSTFVGMQSEGGAPTDAGYWPIYADARNAVLNWDAEL